MAPRRPLLRAVGAAVLAVVLAACSPQPSAPAAQGAASGQTAAAPNQAGTAGQSELLNVSYDISREFYKDINTAYVAVAQAQGTPVHIQQSHGGSSKQVRSVAEGLQADVVTMNQASDLDFLAERGLVAKDWASQFPDNAAPTTSLSVILARKGNPKQIRDWADLARPGVQAVIPNPKVTGNGRYTWVAIWGAALKSGQTQEQAAELAGAIFAQVPVLDGGGRAATTTFAQRGIGDALVTFENEIPLIQREFGDHFEVVYPQWTVLAENPVAVVLPVTEKKGTRAAAQQYLQWLWSPEAQEIAVRHHLRPRHPEVLARHASTFPAQQAFSVDEVFGGWSEVIKTHFSDGGLYDQAMRQKKAP